MFRILFLTLFIPVVVFAETVSVQVEGMTCQSCVESIEKSFDGLENVKEAKVLFEEKKLVLKSDEKLDMEWVKEVVEKAGYRVVEK